MIVNYRGIVNVVAISKTILNKADEIRCFVDVSKHNYMSDRLVDDAERNVWESIRRFNRQREPKLVAQKYLKMRQNAFACAGKIGEIVEDNARGIVADLLKTLSHRKRSKFLDERTNSTRTTHRDDRSGGGVCTFT